MPIPDDKALGPGLEKHLKAALDQVTPPSPSLSSARYRMGAARRFSRAWRFAPALVAIAAAGAALTATAATGSPNPAIWKDRAGTVIQNASHFPISSPKAAHSPKPQPKAGTPATTARPTEPGDHESEPKPTARPTERPAPSPTPEPSDRPEPTPTPDQSNNDGN
jgi:outer membrane biosynthesis protein TonB